MTTALEIQHHSQATKGNVSQFFKVCKSLKFAELKVQTASTLCNTDWFILTITRLTHINYF